MASPLTQTRPQRHRFREEVWTTLRVDRPGVALISRRGQLGILLAKDVRFARGSGAVLRGVQWVRIPQGWRLRLSQLRAWLGADANLPDEWLFMRVRLEQRGDWHLARLPGGDVLPTPSEKPFPLHLIPGERYERLVAARGRDLLAEVRSLFGIAVAPLRPRRFFWRDLLPRPTPYPLFGG